MYPFHLQARYLNVWTMGFIVSPFLSPFAFGFLVAREKYVSLFCFNTVPWIRAYFKLKTPAVGDGRTESGLSTALSSWYSSCYSWKKREFFQFILAARDNRIARSAGPHPVRLTVWQIHSRPSCVPVPSTFVFNNRLRTFGEALK